MKLTRDIAFSFCIAAMSALALNAHAVPLTYNLTYTEVGGGPSVGTGSVTIDSSVLAVHPNLFLFTTGGFVDAFSLSFTGFPGHASVNFGLGDLGAAFLSTDASSVITDFNFWTYDRIGGGGNTCPACTDIYLAGIGTFAASLTDPRQNGLQRQYNILLTPAAVPEPAALALVALGLAALGYSRRRKSA